jgi:hypothetical protein
MTWVDVVEEVDLVVEEEVGLVAEEVVLVAHLAAVDTTDLNNKVGEDHITDPNKAVVGEVIMDQEEDHSNSSDLEVDGGSSSFSKNECYFLYIIQLACVYRLHRDRETYLCFIVSIWTCFKPAYLHIVCHCFIR